MPHIRRGKRLIVNVASRVFSGHREAFVLKMNTARAQRPGRFYFYAISMSDVFLVFLGIKTIKDIANREEFLRYPG